MKEHSLWLVNTNPTYAVSDFTVKPLHRHLGVYANRTCAQVGDDLFVLTRVGVIRIARAAGTDQQNSIDNTDPVSRPIEDWIKKIDWTKPASWFSGYYYVHRYFLSVPIKIGGNTSIYTLVYNTVTGGWCGPWLNTWDARCFSRIDNQNLTPGRLRFGRSDGTVWQWDDYTLEDAEVTATYQDNGTSYASQLKTKGYQFGEPKADKWQNDCTIDFNKSNALVTVSAVIDGSLPQSVQLVDSNALITGGQTGTATTGSSTTGIQFDVLRKNIDFEGLPPGNEIQVQLDASSGKMRVRSIQLTAMAGSSAAPERS
jgi:hypothetical protein